MNKQLLATLSFSVLLLLQTNAQAAPPTVKPNKVNTLSQLKDVIQDLKKRYSVDFIYENNIVEGKQVLYIPQKSESIEHLLTNILTPVSLNYKKIDPNVYAIIPQVSSKKQDIKLVSNSLELMLLQREPSSMPLLGLSMTTPQMTAIRIDRRISGRVLSVEDNQALPGVSVIVKGSSTGTVTDSDGKYSINVPDNGASLVFSYVGFTSQEIAVKNSNLIDISLSADVKNLEQVVVVGYGEVKKSDLTGSVGVADRKKFGDVVATTAEQLIQGKIAGVQVVNNNGLPGSGVSLVIRGSGSFNDVAPLYVIDGIIGDINSVSPYDIDNITVLKDASSVAIYGAQGANGVVLVNTKRAKTGKPRITYNGYTGISQAWRKLDMLNATQYVDLVKDIADATQATLPAKLNGNDVRVDRTNWQNEIFRTAKITEHHINITGGAEKLAYNFSLGYTNQDAIMTNYNYKRFNARFNLEENMGRFKFGQTLNIRYSLNEGNPASFIDALRMPPYAPVYDPTNLGGFSRVTTIEDLNDAYNPLTGVYLSERKSREIVNLGQAFGEVQLMEGLKFRSQVSYTFGFYQNYNYQQANRNGNLLNANGINESYGWYSSPVFENFLSFNKKFGGIHQLDVIVGTSYRGGGRYRSISAIGSNFTNDDIKQIGVSGKSSLSGASSGRGEILYTPIFSRINYTLKDKYLLTLSMRRDFSSNFGVNARFGNFPSAAIAWKLHEEGFLKNITWLTELKLRASWGISGNSSIGQFRATETFLFRGYGNNNIVYSLGANKDYTSGTTVTSIPNPDLRWEETTQTDIGFDARLFGGKVGVTFDYYNRQNNGLLVNVPIPFSTGLGDPYNSPSIPANAANAFNKGVELTLNYNDNIGNFKYGISGNVNYNQNQVVSLGQVSESPIRGGGFQAVSTMTYTAAGFPIGAFWGYQVDKIASSKAEVAKLNEAAASKTGKKDAVYQAELAPGDIIFKDLNGDGVVDEKDQGYLGSPIPKWNYGLNLNASYKAFDFMLGLQGVAGVELVNGLNYWLEGTTRPFNSNTNVLRRWKKDGDVTDMPRAGQNANGNLNLRPSDRYIQNGAYMRIRNITFGYNIPSALLAKTKTFSTFRIYFTAMNAFTFTKYTGYDPEVSSNGGSNSNFLFDRGIDNGQYPQARTLMVGFQVGF